MEETNVVFSICLAVNLKHFGALLVAFIANIDMGLGVLIGAAGADTLWGADLVVVALVGLYSLLSPLVLLAVRPIGHLLFDATQAFFYLDAGNVPGYVVGDIYVHEELGAAVAQGACSSLASRRLLEPLIVVAGRVCEHSKQFAMKVGQEHRRVASFHFARRMGRDGGAGVCGHTTAP